MLINYVMLTIIVGKQEVGKEAKLRIFRSALDKNASRRWNEVSQKSCWKKRLREEQDNLRNP